LKRILTLFFVIYCFALGFQRNSSEILFAKGQRPQQPFIRPNQPARPAPSRQRQTPRPQQQLRRAPRPQQQRQAPGVQPQRQAPAPQQRRPAPAIQRRPAGPGDPPRKITPPPRRPGGPVVPARPPREGFRPGYRPFRRRFGPPPLILLSALPFIVENVVYVDSARPRFPVVIPAGAKRYKGHSYYVFTNLMTWDEARDFCESQGGYLAVVGSVAEERFVGALTQRGMKGSYWLDSDNSRDYKNLFIVNESGGSAWNWGADTDKAKHFFICEWDV